MYMSEAFGRPRNLMMAVTYCTLKSSCGHVKHSFRACAQLPILRLSRAALLGLYPL